MFERVKKSQEKEKTVQITDDSASTLAARHKDLSDKISKIKYSISLMDSEFEVLERDLNEFLMLYYERFSEELFINDDLLSKYEAKRGQQPEDKKNENIALYERKKKAHDLELKQVYRKLVKATHPDATNAENQQHREQDFSLITNLYEKADLEGLLAVQTELDNQKYSISKGLNLGLVKEVEMMESQEILLNRKFSKAKIKLSKLISSPEYKLYTRYKISEIRGEDFFEILLNSI